GFGVIFLSTSTIFSRRRGDLELTAPPAPPPPSLPSLISYETLPNPAQEWRVLRLGGLFPWRKTAVAVEDFSNSVEDQSSLEHGGLGGVVPA
ncbi:hypothetical protein PIB30_059714, partial [Stylosanthes scabra]|nr:hypothetical protein [Stylosanthes scabra]